MSDRFAIADQRLLVVSGVLLVVAVVLATAREVDPPWAASQDIVRAEVTKHLGAEKAEALPSGIQQIWIEPLDRVDRCVTCHQSLEWGEALAASPHPARSHPHPALLEAHPVELYGCTLCHGGQGMATTVEAGHGHVLHWEEPMLDTQTAERYGLTQAELMEGRCAVCHVTIDEVEGMPLINSVRERLFDCIDCHRMPGIPPGDDPKAPDLRRLGEKHPTKYTFPDDYDGPRTAMAWHIEHFLDPNRMTPGSTMTKFTMTRKEAAALSLLVLSWRRHGLPPEWIPKTE